MKQQERVCKIIKRVSKMFDGNYSPFGYYKPKRYNEIKKSFKHKKNCMRKNIFISLIAILALFSVCGGGSIQALEDNPAYLISDDYIIIDHVKYDLVNNKINYYGLEYELIEGSLVAYDEQGVPNVIVLPVEENKITDEDEIRELNSKIGKSDVNTRAVPTNPKNLPYSANVSAGNWYVETPAVKIIDGTAYRVTKITLSNFSSSAVKRFSVVFRYCDALGNWYKSEQVNDYNFGKVNYLRFQNLSTTRYGMFALGSLYDEPSYKYTISRSKI